jgi:hypothetical protein
MICFPAAQLPPRQTADWHRMLSLENETGAPDSDARLALRAVKWRIDAGNATAPQRMLVMHCENVRKTCFK